MPREDTECRVNQYSTPALTVIRGLERAKHEDECRYVIKLKNCFMFQFLIPHGGYFRYTKLDFPHLAMGKCRNDFVHSFLCTLSSIHYVWRSIPRGTLLFDFVLSYFITVLFPFIHRSSL